MKIVIIDTYSGLCNQFYDINCGINFCIINNIKFSFRYCSFRNPNLMSWYNAEFNKLFDTSLLKKYENLYVEFENIHLTDENTYNLKGDYANILFTSDYLNEIVSIPKDYVVLNQFWAVYKFTSIVDNVFSQIRPSKRLMELYDNIKNQLLQTNEQYNCIHYRYEADFTSYFNITIENLKDIILRIKPRFKNPNLRIYIATSNINEVIDASGGSPNMYGSSIVSSGWGSGVITFTLTGLPLGASIITASSLCATHNSINDWALITMG